ncbi:MAG: hypothetical protein HQL97_01480 [Magnetococcales bacterium]|nr:hypothetical protein [Magnetococcales bacterium]
MIYDRLQMLLNRIQPLLDEDDGLNALSALRAIMEAFTIEWVEYDEESDSSVLYEEMGEMIAEALLRADPPARARQEWQTALQEWHDELADYGTEEGLKVAIQAAAEGWESAELQAVLRGDVMAVDEEAEVGADDDPLVRIRLRILAQRGRHAERLNLARYHGEYGECAQTLFHLGRLDEAEEIATTRLTSPVDLQALAYLFYDRGDVDRALRIARRALDRQDVSGLRRMRGHLDLARWLRDTARTVGNQPLALQAAESAFMDQCEMADYLAVEQVAGGEWPTIRENLLQRMTLEAKVRLSVDKVIAICLHEGLVAQAVVLADQERFLDQDRLREVMRAAMNTHAEWVIRRSRAEAEEIMDAARSNAYDVAAEWLALTRNAYLQAERGTEWSSLLATLIQKHVRKYKLKPLLKALR